MSTDALASPDSADAPTARPINFQISLSAADRAVITWTETLGLKGSPCLRRIESQLMSATGVEDVLMDRYSATLRLAPHAMTLDTFMRGLRQVLETEEVIQAAENALDEPVVIRANVTPGFLARPARPDGGVVVG